MKKKKRNKPVIVIICIFTSAPTLKRIHFWPQMNEVSLSIKQIPYNPVPAVKLNGFLFRFQFFSTSSHFPMEQLCNIVLFHSKLVEIDGTERTMDIKVSEVSIRR